MLIETRTQLAEALADRMMYGLTSREFAQIIREKKLWVDAMALCREGGRSGRGGTTAFRAAWSLEAAYFAAPDEFAPHLAQFVADFPVVRNRSVHRHYTKILRDALRRGAVRLAPAEAESIAEACFDRLIDPDAKVAVKAWTADVLMLLLPQVPWIGEHLGEVLRQLMGDGSPGMVSHGRKLLAQLG